MSKAAEGIGYAEGWTDDVDWDRVREIANRMVGSTRFSDVIVVDARPPTWVAFDSDDWGIIARLICKELYENTRYSWRVYADVDAWSLEFVCVQGNIAVKSESFEITALAERFKTLKQLTEYVASFIELFWYQKLQEQVSDDSLSG